MNENMSEFKKVFGDNDDVSSCLAQIRDDYWNDIVRYITDSSAIGSKECVLFAIHKLLAELKELQKMKDK